MCAECSETDMVLGICARNANDTPIPEQAYCNDGTHCQMPNGRTNYSKYKCPAGCANATACQPCSTASGQSTCRIEQIGQPMMVQAKPIWNLTSDYWEFIAGLPKSQKCCLNASGGDAPPFEYTYGEILSTKSRSEFLQYPGRGEESIDCGRTPDTSVLKYCGVTIPISQMKFTCFKT